MKPPWAALTLGIALSIAACGPPPIDPMPPNQIAFGVFGDGPYDLWERGRWRRVLDDVSRADLEWWIHVGDLFWYPCSDAAYERRLRQLNAVPHPVLYTPGDNEWTDCHEARAGRYEPLDRLAKIRRTFFADPHRSLGDRALALESQADDPAFAEFRENVRWTRGGFVFATVHLVGSSNGLDLFTTRTPAHDAEVARRTQAAIAWLDETFAQAHAVSAKAVVVATHANIGLGAESRRGFDLFVERLKVNVAEFPGPVLWIHGDSHQQRVDQPLEDASGRVYDNFTRLETFGSPDIGWVRVVVDTVAGRVTRYEPRRMRGWW